MNDGQPSIADKLCERWDLRPIFAPARQEPVWIHFWSFLLVGLVLRLFAALTSDWIYRLDELWEYLSQAHRLVYGYGVVPWEYIYGARNWLLVLPAAGVLWTCEWLGFGHPDYYVPAVKVMNSVISMILPVGTYFFMRRHVSEKAARLALAFCCLWWDMIVFAPHTMAEAYTVVVIFAALGLFRPDASAGRLAICGFLLGLSCFLRTQFAPSTLLLGGILLLALPPKRMLIGGAGALSGVIFYGWVDYLTWGQWWQSTINMVAPAYHMENIWEEVEGDSIRPLYQGLIALTACSFGLYPLMLVCATLRYYRHWLLLSIILPVLAINGAFYHFYSYLFLMFPLFACLFGSLLANVNGKKLVVMTTAAATISVAGLTHNLHGLTRHLNAPRFFFHESTLLAISKTLSRLPEEEVKAVIWTEFNPWTTGSYYYTHHPAPLYYLQYDYAEEHNKIIRESGLPWSRLASHIIAWDDRNFDGFEAYAVFNPHDYGDTPSDIGDIVIFRNITGNDIHIPEKFLLDKPARHQKYMEEHFGDNTEPPVYLPRRQTGDNR